MSDRPTFRRAIVRAPAPNFADGLTSVDLGTPDVATALAQHEAYCRALEGCGLELTRLPADPRFPDSTFVEDTAVITERGAVLTRPGAPSREGEVAAIDAALREIAAIEGSALAALFPAFRRIQAPGTVDGGDVCEAADHFFIRVGARTNDDGARQLAQHLAEDGYSSTLVDLRGIEGLLHLKSGIAWLGGKTLLVIDALASHPAFRGWDLVRVPSGEEYASNCVIVNDRLFFAEGFPRLERDLREQGHRLAVLPVSEFQKMDGGLSCLSLRF